MISKSFLKIFRLLSKKRLFLTIILIFVFIFIFKAYLNHIFFLDFADEEENFLLGKFILNGKKLYADIFTQHQPINFLISAFIQKIINPQTISALVKTHRLAIILWSVIWAIILTLRFSFPLLITVLIIELTKITLLGNLFLAESLVIYPLVYIVAYTFFVKKDQLTEFIFVSLLIIFVFYNLLPLWPLMIFLSLYLILRNNKRLAKGLIILGIFILTTLIIFYFSDIKNYFYNTIYITIKYYLPLSKKFAFKKDVGGNLSFLKAFLAPAMALFEIKKSQLLWVIKSLSLTLIINLALLWKHKKKLATLIIFILGLSSLRYVPPSAELYGGFHMLPWFSLLVLFVLITSLKLIKQNTIFLVKAINIFLIILVLSTAFIHSKYCLFDIRNPKTDLHVHYSPQYQYSQALKIMKNAKDTLFVIPANMLIFWDTDILPASKYTYFYPWMEKTTMSEDIKQIFTKNPPTFLYCQDCQKTILYKYINNYQPLKKSGNLSFLYVRYDKLGQLSKEQIDRLKLINFELVKKNQ